MPTRLVFRWEELAEPPASGRRATARLRWLSRYRSGFPGRI